MSSALCNGDRREFAALFVRVLVVLLFVVSSPLNAFAMNGPAPMHGGDMVSAQTGMSMMDDHDIHGVSPVNFCQMMTQCNGALAMPDQIELASSLFRFNLLLPPQSPRERVVQPPYHPPIV